MALIQDKTFNEAHKRPDGTYQRYPKRSGWQGGIVLRCYYPNSSAAKIQLDGVGGRAGWQQGWVCMGTLADVLDWFHQSTNTGLPQHHPQHHSGKQQPCHCNTLPPGHLPLLTRLASRHLSSFHSQPARCFKKPTYRNVNHILPTLTHQVCL